jgi:hypothetical protein
VQFKPVFEAKQRLPGQVFGRPYRLHLLREFDYAMEDLMKAF